MRETLSAHVLDEVKVAHDEVITRRHRAGLAACLLLESTDVWYADWPRATPRAPAAP